MIGRSIHIAIVLFTMVACSNGQEKEVPQVELKGGEDEIITNLDSVRGVLDVYSTSFSWAGFVLIKDGGEEEYDRELTLYSKAIKDDYTDIESHFVIGMLGADICYSFVNDKKLTKDLINDLKITGKNVNSTVFNDSLFLRIEQSNNISNIEVRKDSLIDILYMAYTITWLNLDSSGNSRQKYMLAMGEFVEYVFILSSLSIETKNSELLKNMMEDCDKFSEIESLQPEFDMYPEMEPLFSSSANISKILKEERSHTVLVDFRNELTMETTIAINEELEKLRKQFLVE